MDKVIKFISKITDYCKEYKYISTIFFIILILISSFITRFYNLSNPPNLIFDEHYFIPMADKYIRGEFYGDPHPPLGRLLITAGALVYPDDQSDDLALHHKSSMQPADILKYRIVTASFGALVPLLVFLITKIFTQSNTFAFLASYLTIFDNALTLHTRFALFDEILIFFVLLSFLLSLLYIKYTSSSKEIIFDTKNLLKRFAILLAAGIFAGAALSTKLIGLSSVAFLYIAIIYKTYKDRFSLNLKSHILILAQILLSFFAISSIFLLSHKIHFDLFNMSGENLNEFSPDFQECVLEDKSKCKMSLISMTLESVRWSFNYEKHVPSLDLCKPDEMGSAPYRWPFMGRVIALSFTNHKGIPLTEVSYIYLTGNPLVWYLGLLGVVISISLCISSVFLLKSSIDKKLLFLIFAYLINFIPYFFIDRVMYFYHYFIALIFSLILFSMLVQKFYYLHLKSRISKMFGTICMIILLLLVLTSFLLYAPLTYNKRISTDYMQKLIITDFWNLKVDPFRYEEN